MSHVPYDDLLLLLLLLLYNILDLVLLYILRAYAPIITLDTYSAHDHLAVHVQRTSTCRELQVHSQRELLVALALALIALHSGHAGVHQSLPLLLSFLIQQPYSILPAPMAIQVNGA